MSKQGATITGVKGLGFQLKGNAPADSNKLIRKDELNNWYYVDNVAAGISSYPDNRIMTYEDLIAATFVKPATPFYQYDVTRSGIPGALGRYFTYIGSDLQTYTVQQDEYGFVGTFCMQEDSYMNNSYGVYTFTKIGVCYPYYGAYPQPYINNCCLYFNNLGSYTVSDVKIYQLVSVNNIKQNWTTIVGTLSFLGAVPGVNVLWGAASLLVIIGGELYNQGSHLSNQLRYTGVGTYTNGSTCLNVVGSSLGTPQYYIAYKVKNPQGNVVAAFGYGSGESAPPGFNSSCVGSGTGGSTTANWVNTGSTACVDCANVIVYRDDNAFSSTVGKYKVGTTGTVVSTNPSTAACDTTQSWVIAFGEYECDGCTRYYKQIQNNPCAADAGTLRRGPVANYDYSGCGDCCGQSTTADWTILFGSYGCSNCNKYYNEIDLNSCSATYNQVRVSGVLVESNSTFCGGCCGQSTTQVWTNTGAGRCVDCVSQVEQRQTNSCASNYDGLRWVNGGSNCDPCCGQSTAANWTLAFGSYSCSGCTKYYNEVDLNSCSPTYGQERQSSTVAEYDSTYCGGTCGQSTAADWTIQFGSYGCSGCDKHYMEMDLNQYSPTYQQTRVSSAVAEYNSSYCCTFNTCYQYQAMDYGWINYTDCMGYTYTSYMNPWDTFCAQSVSGGVYQLGTCSGFETPMP